jgi:hypothetical protein
MSIHEHFSDRRRKKDDFSLDVLKLIGVLIFLFAITGMLPKVLFGLAVFVAVVFFGFAVVYLVSTYGKASTNRPAATKNPPMRELRPDIEVICPCCSSELVAPGDMAGKKARCESCRAEFDVPKPKIKFPDASKFYFSEPAEMETSRFTLELIRELEWKRFEQLVEGYFARTGWRTKSNGIGPDGGVDVHLFKPDQPNVAAIVQCKAYLPYRIKVGLVRELLGVMAKHQVPEGFFVTTSTFTGDAVSFVRGLPITLIDGPDLLRRILALPDSDQAALLEHATRGDYKTPICPSCGQKMVARVASKGKNVGEVFWGCPAYPKCKGTLNMRK